MMRTEVLLAILLILGIALLSVTATAFASYFIGPVVKISNQSVDAVFPSVAYNPAQQEYLVVWNNDRPGNDDIQAQRVSKDGSLVGPSFYISAGAGAERSFPSVAYNTREQEYLVVWQHYDQSTGKTSIRGQRVSPSGLLLGGEFTVTDPWPDAPSAPVVAYASTENKYLIVWVLSKSSSTHIAGRTLLVTAGNTSLGNVFMISEDTTGTAPRWAPDLAYNRARNEFLVVWQQEFTSNDHDIYAQRVKMTGGEGLLGNPLEIYAWTSDDTSPAVAAIPKPGGVGQYLVVWLARTSSTCYDVIGRLVTGDGQVDLHYTTITFSTTPSGVDVAGSEGGERYLVAWGENIGLSLTEISMGGQQIGDLFLVTWSSFSGYPAVASGPLADFFVSFHDNPSFTTYDIYGQLWGNRYYIPLTLRNK